MALSKIDVANMLTGEVPNANVATIGVAKGGTGLTSGTSGQFLKFTGSTTLASAARKLGYIKDLRNQKLQETDYMANSDVTMPDYIKTWRQTLRDLPQNNTTESQYDALLAKDGDGKLTNSVWKQPKE